MKSYLYGGFSIRFPDYLLQEICTDTLIPADDLHSLPIVNIYLKHIHLSPDLLLKGMCVGDNGYSKLIYLPEIRAYYLKMENGTNIFITTSSITLDINWDNYYEGMIDRYILRHGMILLERLNGVTTLHGLAFTHAQKAYAIIGPSGYGKSTLALALNKYAGCEILTDDCVVISPDCSSILNCQNAVHINLDSANALNVNVSNLKYSENDEYKLLYPCHINESDRINPSPIGGVFFITRHDKVEIKKCVAPIAFSLMCKNIKMSYEMIDPLLRNDIATIAGLVRKFRSYELSFPKSYSTLPTIVDAICSLIDSSHHNESGNAL